MTTVARDRTGGIIQALRPTTTTRLLSSGTAVSTVLEAGIVRIGATADGNYSLVGTATVADVWMPAGGVEYIEVNDGDTLSWITTSGSLYVTVAE